MPNKTFFRAKLNAWDGRLNHCAFTHHWKFSFFIYEVLCRVCDVHNLVTRHTHATRYRVLKNKFGSLIIFLPENCKEREVTQWAGNEAVSSVSTYCTRDALSSAPSGPACCSNRNTRYPICDTPNEVTALPTQTSYNYRMALNYPLRQSLPCVSSSVRTRVSESGKISVRELYLSRNNVWEICKLRASEVITARWFRNMQLKVLLWCCN